MDILRQLYLASQGASRELIAGGLGAPVDTITAILNLGLPASSRIKKPAGGSDWIAENGRALGLLQDEPGTTADTLGALAMLLAPLPAMAGPRAARAASAAMQRGAVGDLKRADRMNAAQRNAALPPERGGLGLPPDNTAADRAAAMGYERGWWRGGPAPKADAQGNTPPTGQWYTSNQAEAHDYARRTPNSDVREYAVPGGFYMQGDRQYPGRFLTDLAANLRKTGDPRDAKLATDFEDMAAKGESIPASLAMMALRNSASGDPADYLSKMARGLKGSKGPDYLEMFGSQPVRDATRAAFDPARRNAIDIYGRATPDLLTRLAIGSLGGLGAARLWGDE